MDVATASNLHSPESDRVHGKQEEEEYSCQYTHEEPLPGPKSSGRSQLAGVSLHLLLLAGEGKHCPNGGEDLLCDCTCPGIHLLFPGGEPSRHLQISHTTPHS